MEVSPVDVGIELLGSGDWANSKDDGVGDILTAVVVLLGLVVGGGLGDIGGNALPVGEEVLGQGGDELSWVSEDGSPGLDLLDVALDILAVIEVSWELLDDLTELLNSLDDVLEVTLGEIRESIGDLNLKALSVVEAGLDLWEIILLDKTVDDTSDELLGTLDVHLVVSGDDASSGLNESHFSI